MKKKYKNFTVVVSSGGIKPLAAIPFFTFLGEHQLEPSMLLGCSGGAYITCFWADGARTEKQMHSKVNTFLTSVDQDHLFNDIDYRTLLGTAGYPFGRFNKDNGMIFGDKLLEMYQKMSGDRRLEDLSVKTILQATNLETGEPVFLEKGDMASAIYASSALYPILPPINIDGKWLVDGAYHSEVPLTEAVNRTNDVIIVLVFEQAPPTHHNSFLTFFTSFIGQVAHHHTHTQNSFAVNLHQNDIIFLRYYFKEAISIWDTKKLPLILDVGKQEILDILTLT